MKRTLQISTFWILILVREYMENSSATPLAETDDSVKKKMGQCYICQDFLRTIAYIVFLPVFFHCKETINNLKEEKTKMKYKSNS